MEYLIMTAKDDERDQDDARHERLTKETKVESSNRPTGKLHCDWNHGKDGVNTFCFFCGATKGKGACNF